MSNLMFSQRKRLAEEATATLARMSPNADPRDATNIVTALDRLGYIRRPGERDWQADRPNFRIVVGDLLDQADAIPVIPVCCVPGVMGAGLAKAFADRHPWAKAAHKDLCEEWDLSPGDVLSAQEPGYPKAFYAATKNHWRDPSRPGWVFRCLGEIATFYADTGFSLYPNQIAMPALGCGLGGLDWNLVGPMISGWADCLPEGCTVTLYRPR